MPISYLVSTAGHAQHQNSLYAHEVRSILQLVQEGARELGDEKVVGFALAPEEGSGEEVWRCVCYSYPELLTLAQGMAAQLGVPLNPEGSEQKIVNLLCPTGPDFLVTWLALMGLGYGVVLVAPQCSPSAIRFLLDETASTHLIVHERYTALAGDVPATASCQTVLLPLLPELAALEPWTPRSAFPRQAKPEEVSHVFHSSGTSGQPKPIPNMHGPSAAVLPRRRIPEYLAQNQREPRLVGGESSVSWDAEPAAFTTTPLFHGGVSDLLRAWMARSMLFLYPSSTSPVTTPNVLAALRACSAYLGRTATPQPAARIDRFRINAFLSVPYILTLLAERDEGMDMLARMDLVSTGGAPLDTAVGNRMVERGVKLVSRLGSSECGFLLSSYRDFAADAEWEWLRNDSAAAAELRFEPVDAEASSSKCEMVVGPGWESKTKSNRPDGSYATGDLYERHPNKAQVWRYAGRGDDVIVLSNGEKASPGPIETALRSCPGVADVLVCGSDQAQLSVLIFPASFPPAADLQSKLEPFLSEANKASPSHAFVAPEMCAVVTAAVRAAALPKSSKGTIQRGVAYDVYKPEIEVFYAAPSGGSRDGPSDPISESDIKEYLLEAVSEMTKPRDGRASKPLKDHTDLFNYGVDSVRAARLRLQLLKRFAVDPARLPANVVFENPTIVKLAATVARCANGQHQEDSTDAEASELDLMRSLADRYGDFSALTNGHVPEDQPGAVGLTVVLTGATGSLGAQIVHALLQQPEDVVREVICLVRAADDTAAASRVRTALKERQLESDSSRLKVVAATLSDRRVGLNEKRYNDLASTADVIIHAAWAVHFGSRLESFEEDHIAGTRHLLDLTASTKRHARFLFCSSLAAVLASNASRIAEQPSKSPNTASAIGYARSKWVAEQICERAAANSHLSGRIAVLRIGQLCGDTRTGRWNESEGWPLMFRTAQTTGALPVLNEAQSWLPSDIAAEAVVDIALARDSHAETGLSVLHVVNPQLTAWDKILHGLDAAGVSFDAVSPPDWVRKVEATPDEDTNPSKHMLPLWRRAYGDKTEQKSGPPVDSGRAEALSPALRSCGAITSEQLRVMVDAWRTSGFLA